MVGRYRRESSLIPPPHPPKPPDEGKQFRKTLWRLLLFVVIHQIFGR